MKRFAFLTDIHLAEEFPLDNQINPSANFEHVLADLVDRKIDKIVFGGDIGGAASHDYFFERLRKFQFRLVIGNHDKFEEVRAYYTQSIGDSALYFGFEEDSYLYIFLDSSLEELSAEQLVWLENLLKTQSKPLILFIHHPVLPIDTPVDRLYALANRDELKSILLSYGYPVTVFCGHYHMNDAQQFENIQQLTTMSLSFQVDKFAPNVNMDNSRFGYRIVELREDAILTQVIEFLSCR